MITAGSHEGTDRWPEGQCIRDTVDGSHYASNRRSTPGTQRGPSLSNRAATATAGCWPAAAPPACPGSAGAGARVAEEVMRPVVLLMTRKMLLGIKDRAEPSRRCRPE